MSLSPIFDSFPNFNVKYLKLLKICQIVMFLEMNIDYAKVTSSIKKFEKFIDGEYQNRDYEICVIIYLRRKREF